MLKCSEASQLSLAVRGWRAAKASLNLGQWYEIVVIYCCRKYLEIGVFVLDLQ